MKSQKFRKNRNTKKKLRKKRLTIHRKHKRNIMFQKTRKMKGGGADDIFDAIYDNNVEEINLFLEKSKDLDIMNEAGVTLLIQAIIYNRIISNPNAVSYTHLTLPTKRIV